MPTRRKFVATAAATAVVAPLAGGRESSAVDVACNEYPWWTFADRAGDTRPGHDAVARDVAGVGFAGFEPIVEDIAAARRLPKLVREHGLSLESIYVNSTLHEPERWRESVAQVVAIAETSGCRIVVTNPAPIRWGGAEDKSDVQLRTQAQGLTELGRRLAGVGVTLAYHNHDSEWRQGAREFHHMLAATDPRVVKFCLDAHWCYRGGGDSAVALNDVVRLYGERIAEMHLRQSRGGIWTEAFGPGDIDYAGLWRAVRQRTKAAPRLVLEQAVEEGTPHTMTAAAAHAAGLAYAAALFSA